MWTCVLNGGNFAGAGSKQSNGAAIKPDSDWPFSTQIAGPDYRMPELKHDFFL
jgi:hypothetical protein